jgi:hypothetical protein
MLMTLPAASVFQYWTDDADYASALGCATSDPNASLDELRRLWARISPDVYCRYTPNIGAIGTYVQLQPGARDTWLARLPAERISSNPLLYDVTLTAFVEE